MKLLKTYLEEIDSRKKGGLSPKPIDNGPLLNEIIATFEDENSQRRTECLNFYLQYFAWHNRCGCCKSQIP